MTNGEKFKEVFGFGADGSRVIAVNAIWWDCEFHNSKPITNADRIRSMTDEELAHFIDEFWSAPWCPDEPPIDSETKECMMHEGKCEMCILDWLKQEADT